MDAIQRLQPRGTLWSPGRPATGTRAFVGASNEGDESTDGWASSPGDECFDCTGIGARRAAEGDGVLHMLLWLGRSPESFVPGYEERGGVSAPLPKVRADEVLRFDTRKLYAALDARRVERGLTWAQVGKEIGLSAASLTYLAKGTRTGFPQVMRLTRWLGRPAAEFTRACSRWEANKPQPLKCGRGPAGCGP